MCNLLRQQLDMPALLSVGTAPANSSLALAVRAEPNARATRSADAVLPHLQRAMRGAHGYDGSSSAWSDHRTSPGHRLIRLAPPLETAEPDASPDFLPEPVQGPPVVRHAGTGVLAAEHTGVPAVLIGQRHVHQPSCSLVQHLQLVRQALALRFEFDNELPPRVHPQW
jgi:hypothetical protein